MEPQMEPSTSPNPAPAHQAKPRFCIQLRKLHRNINRNSFKEFLTSIGLEPIRFYLKRLPNRSIGHLTFYNREDRDHGIIVMNGIKWMGRSIEAKEAAPLPCEIARIENSAKFHAEKASSFEASGDDERMMSGTAEAEACAEAVENMDELDDAVDATDKEEGEYSADSDHEKQEIPDEPTPKTPRKLEFRMKVHNLPKVVTKAQFVQLAKSHSIRIQGIKLWKRKSEINSIRFHLESESEREKALEVFDSMLWNGRVLQVEKLIGGCGQVLPGVTHPPYLSTAAVDNTSHLRPTTSEISTPVVETTSNSRQTTSKLNPATSNGNYSVRISNLPAKTNPQHFKKFVVSKNLKPNKRFKCKEHDGRTFVQFTFKTEEDSNNAVQVLNGESWMGHDLLAERTTDILHRNRMKVDNIPNLPGYMIEISNFRPGLKRKNDVVDEFFTAKGIYELKITSKHLYLKDKGYFAFETEECREMALERLNGAKWECANGSLMARRINGQDFDD